MKSLFFVFFAYLLKNNEQLIIISVFFITFAHIKIVNIFTVYYFT